MANKDIGKRVRVWDSLDEGILVYLDDCNFGLKFKDKVCMYYRESYEVIEEEFSPDLTGKKRERSSYASAKARCADMNNKNYG